MISSAMVVRSALRLASAAAAGSVLSLGALSAHASDLTGTSVDIDWLFPNTGTSFASDTVTVGAGPELTCAGGGAGTGLCTGFIDAAQFDLGANTLSLTITSGSAAWSGASFNGYEFSGLSAGGPWSGFTLSTNFSGLNTSRVSFTPDAVWVNMQGITPAAGQSFTITLLPGVPEPSTWAMMMVGFGGLGLMARRRRAIAAA